MTAAGAIATWAALIVVVLVSVVALRPDVTKGRSDHAVSVGGVRYAAM